MAALLPHVCISAAQIMFPAWSTRRGGRGARRSEDTSPLPPAWGSGAACSHSVAAAPHGRSGPALQIPVGWAGCVAPIPRVRWQRTAVWEFPVRVVAHHPSHWGAHSAPTMCASNAVMELRPMIHSGKTPPRRCFEKPLGRSR